MKRYLLLRDNRSSGPYALEEIISFGLQPMDLVWIENESKGWKYPSEIKELESHISEPEERIIPVTAGTVSKGSVFVSLPPEPGSKEPYQEVPVKKPIPAEALPAAEKVIWGGEQFSQKPSWPSGPVWSRKALWSSSVTSVAAVFLGVVIGAFVIKKLADGYVSLMPEETAAATPIVERTPDRPASEDFKNALVTEILPVYKNIPKTTKAKSVKKQLKLEASNYKVGLFGGINGLQLTVFNTSGQYVDKVIVGVDYLRSNGDVVQSENIRFGSIKPRGSQTIGIPGSNRGVKVRYKILKVYSHDYKTDLKQI